MGHGCTYPLTLSPSPKRADSGKASGSIQIMTAFRITKIMTSKSEKMMAYAQTEFHGILTLSSMGFHIQV